MAALLAATARYVIVGLGHTGLSFARYLQRQGLDFVVTDSAQEPPLLAAFTAEFPDIPLYLGGLNAHILTAADYILLSPGVYLSRLPIPITADDPRLVGDIELFALKAQAPIIAITGTNGKSTVTHLVSLLLEQAGFTVQMAGNVGKPVLDCLVEAVPDYYVLELSSAQLEVTRSLRPEVACILNISEDHMDCHPSFAIYQQAKLRIFTNCQTAVINSDDPHILPPKCPQIISFGSQGKYKLSQEDKGFYLLHEQQSLVAGRDLALKGKHNYYNVLAALAIVENLNLERAACIATLVAFQGLPHRCQKVAEKASVVWVNDSKATNVGATIAAIEGLAPETQGRLILLAGGLGKGADFRPLAPVVKRYVRSVILWGQDAPQIAAALQTSGVPLLFAQNMEDMVAQAQQQAQSGDMVLLAPACASWDHFKNYQERGAVFAAAVERALR